MPSLTIPPSTISTAMTQAQLNQPAAFQPQPRFGSVRGAGELAVARRLPQEQADALYRALLTKFEPEAAPQLLADFDAAEKAYDRKWWWPFKKVERQALEDTQNAMDDALLSNGVLDVNFILGGQGFEFELCVSVNKHYPDLATLKQQLPANFNNRRVRILEADPLNYVG